VAEPWRGKTVRGPLQSALIRKEEKTRGKRKKRGEEFATPHPRLGEGKK